MPGLSRQQLIAWTAVGLIILLIGANYLRGQVSSPARDEPAAVTAGLKEDRTSSTRIKVHVIGAVARPGLYEATAGSRVADVLQQAGGPTAGADLNQINLAAKLTDGQQVLVPEKGAPAPSGSSSGSAGAPAAAGAPVNLNTATLEQIDALDGIGPKTAQKIIDYREAHGGFKSIEELMEVPGIGPAKFEQLKGKITV